jgi:AmpD protein
MLTVVDGWLQGVKHEASPNADERPPGSSVDLVVVHNISLPPGEYGQGAVHELFTNRLDPRSHPFLAELVDARVSAHLLIERDGRVTQFVSFEQRAWHAGASEYEGRVRCNDFSIGVEVEGSDFQPYTDQQYEALNEVLGALLRVYPIAAVRGHRDIAPGRKTDPGPFFDWSRLALPRAVSFPPK